MSKAAKSNKPEKTPVEYKKPAVFAPALIRNYASFDEYFKQTEEMYDETLGRFFESNLLDPDLPEKAAECEEAARSLIMAGAALFGRHTGKFEDKEKAVAILEKCKQDSGIRMENMKRHYDLIKQDQDPDLKEMVSLRKKVRKSQNFFFRAYNTQTRYLNLFVSDPDYMTPELRMEKAAGPRAHKKMMMVPKGHIFLPARPFPPVRIPEGEEVPYPPEAYEEWKALPVEDFVYDIDHDEFVLPEGYVSKDGRIDDKSVVWDWEHNLVTMKFVGEEPITWPFWKPKNTRDVLKPGDWCAEYYIRLYKRFLKDIEPPGAND